MFHRIGHEAGHLVGYPGVIAVYGTEQQVVAYIVGNREVPPDIGRTFDTFVNPSDAFLGDVGDNAVARPHDLDTRIQLVAQCGEISAFRVGPAFVILCGTHDKGSHVLFHFYKVFVDVVQQLCLFDRVGSFTRNIVKENSERAHAQVIHLFKLRQQVVTVFLIPLDVLSRMNGPYEIDFIFFSHLYQFLQLFGFFFGIGQTPVGRTVVRVVFRSVDIRVHLVFAIEFELAQTSGMAPRSAIESFHYTAEADGGVVFYFDSRKLVVFQQAAESLQGIECSSFVISCQYDFFIVDTKIVAFLLIGNAAGKLADGFVSLFPDIDT